MVEVPVQKIVSAMPFSPTAERTRVSDDSEDLPEPVKDAPPEEAL